MEEAAAFSAVVGKVLATNGKTIRVFGKGEQKEVAIFGNPMFPLAPRVGDTVLLLLVEGAYVCCGVLQNR